MELHFIFVGNRYLFLQLADYLTDGEIDWDEFNRVIRGNGPCNKERVALRRFSYEQGEWVRQAILGGTTHAPSKN